MNRAAFGWLLSLVVLTTGVIGCGPKRPVTAPVTGTVTYKGQPVEGAAVMFTRDKGPPATATTDAQGKFALMTYELKDGAIPADYSVAITKMESAAVPQGDPGRTGPVPNQPPPKSLIPKKYSDARTSELKQTVKAGTPNDFTFELKD